MSKCNFPSFSFAFGLPSIDLSLPSLPDFGFDIGFSLPCPLD